MTWPWVGSFSTRNVEPLAQTWVRRECFYSKGHNGLTSSKRIKSSRARAGLNSSTMAIDRLIEFPLDRFDNDR